MLAVGGGIVGDGGEGRVGACHFGGEDRGGSWLRGGGDVVLEGSVWVCCIMYVYLSMLRYSIETRIDGSKSAKAR